MEMHKHIIDLSDKIPYYIGNINVLIAAVADCNPLNFNGFYLLEFRGLFLATNDI